MQAIDNLDGSADAEFCLSGADVERSRGKCSAISVATDKEVPRNNGPTRFAIGLLNVLQGSSPLESSSKHSGLCTSKMFERKRNQPQRGSAIKSGDCGPARVSDQFWSPIECRPDERVVQPRVNSEVQLLADGCDEPSNSPVGNIDTQNSLAERAKNR